MSEQDLRSRLAWWQKRLRLQDWRVELTVGRRSEAPSDLGFGGAGCCRWDVNERLAFVFLVEEADLGKLDAPYLDMERTLLHELVHVLYALAASQDDQHGPGWEQACSAVADALLGLARGLEARCE